MGRPATPAWPGLLPHGGSRFTDNAEPDEVRALYLNGSAIQYADSYIRLAQGTGINAFVVDIVDGTAVSYASPVMQQYSPSAYAAAQDTMEGFKANVQKLRDAGYYVIGRITVFNDAHLAADHPEYVISDLNGTPLKISSMYWAQRLQPHRVAVQGGVGAGGRGAGLQRDPVRLHPLPRRRVQV